jgi:hypothetical protein
MNEMNNGTLGPIGDQLYERPLNAGSRRYRKESRRKRCSFPALNEAVGDLPPPFPQGGCGTGVNAYEQRTQVIHSGFRSLVRS